MNSYSLKLQYYRTALIRTKRGNGRGKTINAKPILLIAIFDQIEKGVLINNKIFFDGCLKECYEKHYSKFEPDMNITPLYKPFFHLQSDGFWHILWENESQIKFPSAKYLRENIKYATLDNALWDLLQDAESRITLREAIINHFLLRI